MESGRCRGCRGPIVWAKTAKGVAQPLDPKPERRIARALLQPPGVKMEKRVVVAYDAATGEHRSMVVDTWPLGAGVVGDEVDAYMPHHATCPEAHKFRK